MNDIFPAFVTHATIIDVAFSMGLLVYIHDRKSFTNRLFFLITIGIACWAISNFLTFYFGQYLEDLTRALVAIRVNMVWGSIITALIAIFAYVFPKGDVGRISFGKTTAFSVASTLYAIAGYFAWEGFDMYRPVPAGSMPATIPNLPILPLWGFVTLAVSIGACVYLIIKYRKSEGDDKIRYASAVIGFASTFILVPIILFLPSAIWGDSRLNYFGPIAFIPLFFGVGYGIVRHNIFNVRLILTEILILTMLLILFFNIFV